MKKLIVIALMTIVFVACKKKSVTPAPEPDPTPVCQTGLTYFTGNYTDENGSKITVVWLNNNCPTANSNDYRVIGLADAINKEKQSQVLTPKSEYVMSSSEYNTGYASMNGGVGKFSKQNTSNNITFNGTVNSAASGVTLTFKKE